eukprot:5843914-Amphidinium_carterae.2
MSMACKKSDRVCMCDDDTVIYYQSSTALSKGLRVFDCWHPRYPPLKTCSMPSSFCETALFNLVLATVPKSLTLTADTSLNLVAHLGTIESLPQHTCKATRIGYWSRDDHGTLTSSCQHTLHLQSVPARSLSLGQACP